MESVRGYYDEFSRKLLADYVHGNPRIERAIEHVIRSLPVDTTSVLEVGCGIGWMSAEISRRMPGVRVTAVDLSPGNIELAKTLFGDEGVRFEVADVTDPDWTSDGPFDGIVMCDVYEHIPDDARSSFDTALARLAAHRTTVVLTFPSASYQHYLRTEEPGGLQPVDEVITEATIDELASTLGASRSLFRSVSVWRPDDYVHAVATSQSSWRERRDVDARPLDRRERAHRAETALGARVTPDGLLLPNGPGPAVLVRTPVRHAYSETFVRNHIERLPARVEVVYGEGLELEHADGSPVTNRWLRLAGKIGRRLPGFGGLEQRLHDASLVRYAKSRQVRVVLSEFGPTAVATWRAFRSSAIPTVAHFHGYDAYSDETLKRYGKSYRRMFAASVPAIAVSRSMKEQLVGLGAKSTMTKVIPSGVDQSSFAGASPATAPAHFAAVGRLVDKKAPHLTLLAFQRVVHNHAGARLTMVGDGPLLETCRALVQALGLGQSVELVGSQKPHYVAELLRRSRGFVQHSVRTSGGDSEGTPVAIIEASSSGLPVVATRHAGIPEIVLDGKTGLLCEEGDIDAMAAHMLLLANDPDLAAELGRAGALRAREYYRLEDRVADLWNVLAEQLRGARG